MDRSDSLKKIKIMYYLSIIALIAAGTLFVQANRQAKVVGILENLDNKTIVFYSSNFKRVYKNTLDGSSRSLDMLCIEGVNYFKNAGLNSEHLEIESGNADPYTQSGFYLKNNLKKNNEYVLIDLSRDQTRYGSQYKIDGNIYCPISIKLSKKSRGYDNSLLFASRVKAYLNEKYKSLPVYLISLEDQDYNQSIGYIGMLVELGDASNTFDEARESLKIFCQALVEVNNAQK